MENVQKPGTPSRLTQPGNRSVALNPRACEFIPSAQTSGRATAPGRDCRNTVQLALGEAIEDCTGDRRDIVSPDRRDGRIAYEAGHKLVDRDESLDKMETREAASALVPRRQRPRKWSNSRGSGTGVHAKPHGSRHRGRKHGPDNREAIVKEAGGGSVEGFEAGLTRGASRRGGGRRHNPSASGTVTPGTAARDEALCVPPPKKIAVPAPVGPGQVSSVRGPQRRGSQRGRKRVKGLAGENSVESQESKDPLDTQLGEAAAEVAPVLPFSLKGKREEEYPALPPAGGLRRTVGQAPEALPLASSAEVQRLDYSSLAERLSEHTKSAAKLGTDEAASATRPSTSSAGSGVTCLVVLPNFGDGSKNNGKICHTASGSLPESNGTDGAGGKSLVPHLSVMAPSPSNLSPSGSAARKKTLWGAATETVALRARLRERWFRLEATKKAERQRESIERGLMAAEDGDVLDSEGESYGAPTRRQGLPDRLDVIQDDDSASDGQNSSEEDIDISRKSSEQEGQPSPRSSSALTVSWPGEDSIPETARLCSGDNLFATTEGDTSGHSALESGSLPRSSRTLSAAGAAAIRRSEAASALTGAAQSTGIEELEGSKLSLSAGVDTSRQNFLGDANSSVGTRDFEGRGPGSSCDDGKADSGPSETATGHSSHGDAVPTLPDEQVYAACETGMAGLLNDLLVRSGGKAADGKDKLRRTPLHLAAEAGSMECVNLLLRRGTRLDQRDRWRETPLHKAARSGNSSIVRTLCNTRMKVNVRNRHRETPLLLAVRAKSADAVSVLLGFGARLDEPDVNGVTPVVEAARSGQVEILMILANSNQAWKSRCTRTWEGPDPGRNVRGKAMGKRHALPSAAHHRGERGGDVSASALSPVHEAAASGQHETLSLLLQLGVSLEERDLVGGIEGETPLGRAVKGGHLDCARLLLDAGAMVGRENARGETPLVIAIRAGQASVVEILLQQGASVDGGRSHGRLTAADGRAPVGAREKMMARRRVEPLQLALRERQFACAAVLIESEARIDDGVFRAVKPLANGSALSEDNRYAGTGSKPDREGGTGRGSNVVRSFGAATSAMTLALQTDIFRALPIEICEIADSASSDGGGLEEDSSDSCGLRMGLPTRSCESWQGEGDLSHPNSGKGSVFENRGPTKELVGGLLPSLGEVDVVLVLDDGSRLPAHSCLLAAFSRTFCDLFLHPQGQRCEGADFTCSTRGGQSSNRTLVNASRLRRERNEPEEAACVTSTSEDDQNARSRDVQPLLVGRNSSRTAVEAAALAATSIADNHGWQSPAVVEWGSPRGDVLVRFWGQGTMAAVLRHIYSGKPPSEVHVDGLGRLLVASVSLRIPRLMRQVEHLLSASLSQRKSNDRSAQHAEAAKLLKAARALGAKDLERRCTLYLQANGMFPAVMKIRRELGIPALNASDVSRGLGSLSGSAYLGSRLAHAWSSSGAVLASSTVAVVAEAKRAVDLSLRKRDVDFDQLVPLLLDPARCASTLSVRYPERAVLLMAAIADACPGRMVGTPLSQNLIPGRMSTRSPSPMLRRCVCFVGSDDSSSSSSSSSSRRRPAVPLGSNFSAFSHDMGWLLRTGVMADVILVLPGLPCGSDAGERSAVACDAEKDESDGQDEGDEGEEDQNGDGENHRRSKSSGVKARTDFRRWETQSAAGATRSEEGVSRESLETDRRDRPAAVTRGEEQKENPRFPAHAMVLSARSEKFAAMLRFVQRQDGDDQAFADGDDTESTGDAAGGIYRWEESGGGVKHLSGAPDDSVGLAGAFNQENVSAPEQAGCGETRREQCCGVDTRSLEDGHRLQPHKHRAWTHVRLQRRNPAPRELELHSPLLSPRSLCLFLEFLYTGVLNPWLSTRELCELALIADEYLVPDLTRQAEALLVECLQIKEFQSEDGSSLSGMMGVSMGSTAINRNTRDEDMASMPLDLLRLALSLGLPQLSSEAAKAVLLQLERVSRSEAFEESGMSKKELVVVALETIFLDQ